ncbi:hypothetical protein BH11MYX1_BH11MYX1_07600 [soil metagenome]
MARRLRRPARRRLFEDNVRELEAAVPADSPLLAEAYTNIADCLTALGEETAAVEPARKALAIRERRGDNPLQTAEARFVLAQAIWLAHRDPAAIAMAKVAREEMRAIGPQATTVPEIERWLAGRR